MFKGKLLFFFVLFCIVITGFYSCKRELTSDKKTLKIGAILPLTGNLAFLGESAQIGLDFAKFYFNKKDSTRIVEIILEDGQGNPSISINSLNKLIDVDKVNVIFSTVSAVDLSLLPIQEKYLFLFISHSTHPKLSAINNLVFRHSPTVSQEVELISSRIKVTDKVTICYMTDDYGVSFESTIKNSIKPKEILSFGFQKGENNFTSIAQKIIETKPDKIIICAGGSNLNTLIQKIREMNCNAQVITTLAFTVSGASKNIEGISNISMISFRPLTIQPEYASILNDYENIKGKKLGTAELLFFNSALLIYECSKESVDVQNISKEITKNKHWDLVGENAKITNTNDILPNLTFIEK